MENAIQNIDVDLTEDRPFLGFSPNLLRKINEFDFSMRAANCMRRESILYIGDLVKRTEAEMLRMPNLGRKTFFEIRDFLDMFGLRFGMEIPNWPPENIEELSKALHAGNLESQQDLHIEEPEDEAAIIENYTNMGLLKKVDLIRLSVRAANCLQKENIILIGDLVQRSESELLNTPNFGRRTLNELRDILATMNLKFGMDLRHWPLPNIESISAHYNDQLYHDLLSHQDEPLKEAFSRTMESIANPRHVFIMEARFGLKGKPLTLEDTAQGLGVTRERVRQIQKKTTQSILKNELWDDTLRIRINKLLTCRSNPLYLDAIGVEDPWFKGFEDNETLLENVLSAFSEMESLNFLTINGRRIIALLSEDDWRNIKYELINILEHTLDHGHTIEDIELLVDSKLMHYGSPELSGLLFEQLSKDLNFSYVDGEMALVSVGNTLANHLRAILETAERPLHFEEIVVLYEQKFGIPVSSSYVHSCLVSHDFLLFDRGTYGLPKHLDIPQHQQDAIRTRLEEIILAGSPNRQWHSRDLIEHLDPSLINRSRPGKYLINVILKPSKILRYLGKWSWKIKSSGDEIVERLYIKRAVYNALKQAGTSLHTDELQNLVSQSRGIGENFCVHPNELFSKIDPSTWGLLERDFILSLNEWEKIKVTLFDLMQTRLRAFHKSELLSVLRDYYLSEDITDNHILGVMMSDSRFKAWHGGFVGLVGWEGPGRKTIDKVMKEIAESTSDSISTDEIINKARTLLGREFNRNMANVYLNKYGLIYDRDADFWKKVQSS